MRTISQYEFGTQLSIRHRLDWLQAVMRKSSENVDRQHECELEPHAAEYGNGGAICFHYPSVSYSVDFECKGVFELRGDTVSIYRADGTCAAVTRTEMPDAPLVAAGHTARPCERPERN